MKKLIAILTILALALSVAPVAFAGTNSYMQISGVTNDDVMCALQVDWATPVAKGQTISFDFRPHLSDDGLYEGLSIRFYNAADYGVDVKPDEYDENGNVISYYMDHRNLDFCDEEQCVVTQGYDGWCTVTLTPASDLPEGFFLRFYYGDAMAYDAGTTLVFDFDNLTVAGKKCSFNETNVTAIGEVNTSTFKFDDGTEFAATQYAQMDWTMALQTEQSTNPATDAATPTPAPDTGDTGNSDTNDDTTDDSTDGTSVDTVWIIVGAVVGVALVAAVLVCVIVLKKRKA